MTRRRKADWAESLFWFLGILFYMLFFFSALAPLNCFGWFHKY